MSLGIYVHWPYCTQICPYCDFNVYRARGHEESPLLEALLADLRGHRAHMGARVAETLFLGGGTPSLLSVDAIARLIGVARDEFALTAHAEITLEANPDERHKFADLAAIGVNRFSIGLQSLRDDALKALGRTHDAGQAIAAIEVAARTGARVSLDLIYARPGQSLGEWRAELREALALPAEHLSLYQLTIEEKTAFGRAARRGALVAPDPECAAELYEATQEMCAAAGAPAYEISNHARGEGAQSRHNLIYWRSGEWIGIGPGAHGRVAVNGQRLATTMLSSPPAYIDAVHERGTGWATAEALGAQAQANEALVMGLRIGEGVARAAVGSVLDEAKVAALADAGLLWAPHDRLSLTPRGRLLADRVAAEIVR